MPYGIEKSIQMGSLLLSHTDTRSHLFPTDTRSHFFPTDTRSHSFSYGRAIHTAYPTDALSTLTPSFIFPLKPHPRTGTPGGRSPNARPIGPKETSTPTAPSMVVQIHTGAVVCNFLWSCFLFSLYAIQFTCVANCLTSVPWQTCLGFPKYSDGQHLTTQMRLVDRVTHFRSPLNNNPPRDLPLFLN
jgi:hypothetical protein